MAEPEDPLSRKLRVQSETSPEDFQMIGAISVRARKLGVAVESITLIQDLTFCHGISCPLRRSKNFWARTIPSFFTI